MEAIKSTSANMFSPTTEQPTNNLSEVKRAPPVLRQTGDGFNQSTSAAGGDPLRNVTRQIDNHLNHAGISANEKIEFPFKRDYDILFHDLEPYRLNLMADSETLRILLTSSTDMKMWKGEFLATYLEDISRKTGREVSFVQFLELLHKALLCQQSNKSQTIRGEKKHIFIDLLCYQDLQLLKARKGQGIKNVSSSVDP